MGPTTRPNVPASTPLATAPVNPVSGASTSRQRNLAILDALVSDPNTSAATRDWAETVMKHLIAGSTQ
jgi:hypothetical protein